MGLGRDCEDGSWMEVAQDHVQWSVLVSIVLQLRVVLFQVCYHSIIFTDVITIIHCAVRRGRESPSYV
jgi:hypothetical protein